MKLKSHLFLWLFLKVTAQKSNANTELKQNKEQRIANVKGSQLN